MNKIFILLFVSTLLLSLSSAFNWNNGTTDYFKFDDASGTSAANAANATNVGTLNNGVAWNSGGIINYATNYTRGSSQYVSTSIVVPSRTKSISMWIYNADNTQSWVLGAGTTATAKQGWGLITSYSLAGDIAIWGQGADVVSNVTMTTGAWHHIVATENSSGTRFLYVDGVWVGNKTDATLNTGSTPVDIGRYAGGSYYSGRVDEVGLFNRTLNQTEVTELYNGGTALPYGSVPTAPVLGITLTNPSNGSITNQEFIDFQANYSINNANFTNVTYYIWYSNGTIFNRTTITISGNTTNSTSLNVSGFSNNIYNWNTRVCAINNTGYICNYNLENYTFTWRPFEIVSQNYTNYVYETERHRFNLTINTIDEVLSVSSKLNYNGTLYPATTTCNSGSCDIYSDIDIPLVTVNKNLSFFWQISVYDGSSSFSFNTTDQILQQNVSRIHLEECDATYTTKTVNFTVYQETNLTRINPFRIAGTFFTWLGSGTVQRNQSFDKLSTSNLSLCISPINKTFTTDAQIEYSFSDDNITYIPRNYYFDNATLTNQTQEINLYLLDAEDSTTFIDKVQDQKLSAVPNALIYIQRYYPSDGLFRTVQIAKTDENGETIGFYEVETVDYKHIIVKNGEILLTTQQQKVVGKEVPFTLTFTVGEVLDTPWSAFESNSSITNSLTYNKTTKIVTFSYIDLSGATSLGRLWVFRESNSNSTRTTICDTSSSQSSATLTCNVTGYDGMIYAYGYIESDVVNVLDVIVGTARDIFGREGLFIGMFIIMISGFAFIWNPTAGIIAINAAIILTNLIGFISVSPIFIFGGIAISILAIILLKT